MKHLKIYEDFDFDENDFDEEEFEYDKKDPFNLEGKFVHYLNDNNIFFIERVINKNHCKFFHGYDYEIDSDLINVLNPLSDSDMIKLKNDELKIRNLGGNDELTSTYSEFIKI